MPSIAEHDAESHCATPPADGGGRRLIAAVDALARWAAAFFERVGYERTGLRLIKPFG